MDRKIRAVGPYKELEKHDYEKELGSGKHIVMPGFINSHHHGKGVGMILRGVKDGPLETWIHEFFVKYGYGEKTYETVLLSCLNQIENGITCTMHHFYGPADVLNFKDYLKDTDEAVRANVDSGIRFAFAPHIYDQNMCTYEDEKFLPKLPKALREKFNLRIVTKQEAAERTTNYFRAFDEIYKKYNGYNDRANIYLGPANVQWCTDGLWLEIKERSERLNTGIHTHLVESRYQAQYGLKKLGASPVEHLQKLGLLSPKLSCGHSVWLTEKDIKIMAQTKAIAVHNPSSNLRLFNGISPILFMKKAGMQVAMGVDGTGINDEEDMFQEMRMSYVLHRIPGVGSTGLTPNEILDINQLGGAKVTGFENEIGSIEVGKKADIILVNSERVMTPFVSPKTSLIDLLIARAKGLDVDSVVVNGEILMENKKLTKANKTKLYQRIKKWKESDQDSDRAVEELVKWIRTFYKSWDETALTYRYNYLSS